MLGNETVQRSGRAATPAGHPRQGPLPGRRQTADEAIKLAQKIIDKLDADETDLLAEAYNTLGTALRKAGRTKDALLAFLHVDVLYGEAPDTHAEALANLVELFTELHKPDHAAPACKAQDAVPRQPWTAAMKREPTPHSHRRFARRTAAPVLCKPSSIPRIPSPHARG